MSAIAQTLSMPHLSRPSEQPLQKMRKIDKIVWAHNNDSVARTIYVAHEIEGYRHK